MTRFSVKQHNRGMVKSKPIAHSTFIFSLRYYNNTLLRSRKRFSLVGYCIITSRQWQKVQGFISASADTSSSYACGYPYDALSLSRQFINLKDVKDVHAQVIKTKIGLQPNKFLSLLNKLVIMYSKFGDLVDAREVFDRMPQRNVVSWTAMISGYAQCGHPKEALELFSEMQLVDIKPNSFTLCTILKICTESLGVELGNQVQAHAIKHGYTEDVFVGSALVDMYAKCGSLEDAYNVFEKLQREHDPVSWNTMIAGFAQHKCSEQAFELFCEMQRKGIEGDQFTFATVIRACPGLKQGKQVHSQIIKNGFESDYYVRGSLVDSYAKFGDVDYARKVLGDILECNLVMCNAMIAGYAQNGQAEEAIKLFEQMYRARMKMDHFTFASVLSASADLAVVEYGKQMHAKVIKTRFELDDCVSNALVDMYAKCGSIDDACQQFNRMYVRDRISWTALITGYAQNGRNEEALKQFCQMLHTNMKANQFTFSSILSACASLASLEKGKQITAHVVKTGFETDVFVGGALIDMHAKCGSMEEAHKVFCKMPEHNVVSWTAMIVGYAQHGHARYALQFFEQMQKAGMKPNHITFVGVLFACGHVGLVDEGFHYFDSMSRDYGITPRVEHYACMVDILSRAGLLEEAMDLINEIPFQHCALVWRILLAACRVHGDIKLGEHAAEHILELEPHDGPTYVLLSNAYAAAGKWNDAAQMRRMMKDRAVKKEPACSWIEVKDQVHVFVVGDKSHPQTKEISSKLQELTGQMKEVGYVAETTSLQDVDYKNDEQPLCYYSESWE